MRIVNGMVFDLENDFVSRDIYIKDGVICDIPQDSDLVIDDIEHTMLESGVAINAPANTVSASELTIDASGCYVIPGLIDLHFHGCHGEDFSDATPDGLQTIADYALENGVTYICPAGMTLPEEQLMKVCQNAARHLNTSKHGAKLVGINLEGPFLSDAKKGAQNGSYLRNPDLSLLEKLQETSDGLVKLVTIAPELPGSMDFIRNAKNVTISVGHTAADYETAAAAFSAGAKQVTHLYNGMHPLHHRSPGVIVAAFDAPDTKVELICDGIHVHPGVVRATFQMFGKERVILISDTLRAAGMPDGQYTLGGLDVLVQGNRAVLADSPDTLAGSATNLMDCLKTAVSFGIPLADAVRAATYNPAQALGMENQIGTLDVGKEATMVLLDKETLEVKKIIAAGEVVVKVS